MRASYPDPDIELAAPEKIVTLRYHNVLSDSPRDPDELIAVYDDEMKTIYLPKNWNGGTPAELSVLVHELVHHLQGATKTKYECPQAREELAYAAQEKWLTLFGRSLESEFEIDPLTLAVRTHCIY